MQFGEKGEINKKVPARVSNLFWDSIRLGKKFDSGDGEELVSTSMSGNVGREINPLTGKLENPVKPVVIYGNNRDLLDFLTQTTSLIKTLTMSSTPKAMNHCNSENRKP